MLYSIFFKRLSATSKNSEGFGFMIPRSAKEGLRLIPIVQAAIGETRSLENSSITVLVGPTGVGKSTIIASMMCEMKTMCKDPETGCLVPEDEAGDTWKAVLVPQDVNSSPELGHTAVSKTRFCKAYSVKGLLLVDSGGTFESRGYEVDMGNALSLFLVMGKSKSASVVMVSNFKSDRTNRAVGLLLTLETTFNRLLPESYIEGLSQTNVGIMLLVNRAVLEKRVKVGTKRVTTEVEATHAEVIQEYTRILDEYVDEYQDPKTGEASKMEIAKKIQWLTFLLREGGKYIQLIHPEDADHSSDALDAIRKLEPIIREDNSGFQLPFSSDTQLQFNQSILGSTDACSLALQKCQFLKEEVAQLTEEKAALVAKKEAENTECEMLNRVIETNDKLENASEGAMAKWDTDKSRLSDEIATLESEIGALRNDYENTSREITRLSTSESEVLEETRKVVTDRPESSVVETKLFGRNTEIAAKIGGAILEDAGEIIEDQTKVKNIKNLGKSLSTIFKELAETTVAEKKESKAVEKVSFDNIRSPLLRVEYGTGSGKWKDQPTIPMPEDELFVVRLVSDSGERAENTIRFYVREKDSTSAKTKIGKNQIAQIETQSKIQTIQRKISEKQAEIKTLEDKLSTTKSIEEKRDASKAQVAEYEKELSSVQDKIDSLCRQIDVFDTQNKSIIETQEQVLTALSEYLPTLDLGSKPEVKRFISLYKEVYK